MSFLAKALQGSSPADALKPELLGSIRVAVVGEASVGKTALTELISSGLPARGTTRSTAGCHIHVKLVDNAASSSHRGPQSPGQVHMQGGSGSGGGGSATSTSSGFNLNFTQQQQQDSNKQSSLPAQQKFFVELWDVSGQPKYSALRSVFFKQLNGVILVYDVTNKSSLSRLQKWASEVAHEGSFVAPLVDEVAARNVGGLPVPVLVVGNKSDRQGFSSHLGSSQAAALSLSGFLNRACTQALLGPSACSSWWPRRLLHRFTDWGAVRRPPSESSMAAAAAEAGLEPHLLGLTTSAAAGDIDWDRLNGFFRSLWERRYQPATAGSAVGVGGAAVSGWGVNPLGAFTGHPSMVLGLPADGAACASVAIAGMGGAGDKAGGGGGGDGRLDDADWV